jgi:hypothetical protein
MESRNHAHRAPIGKPIRTRRNRTHIKGGIFRVRRQKRGSRKTRRITSLGLNFPRRSQFTRRDSPGRILDQLHTIVKAGNRVTTGVFSMEGLRDLTNTVGVDPRDVAHYLTHYTTLVRQINYHRHHMLTWANQDQRRMRELSLLLRSLAWPDPDPMEDPSAENHGLRL